MIPGFRKEVLLGEGASAGLRTVLLAQYLADGRHALAAFRLNAEQAIETGYRAILATGNIANLPIGDGIAQANVHTAEPSLERGRDHNENSPRCKCEFVAISACLRCGLLLKCRMIPEPG